MEIKYPKKFPVYAIMLYDVVGLRHKIPVYITRWNIPTCSLVLQPVSERAFPISINADKRDWEDVNTVIVSLVGANFACLLFDAKCQYVSTGAHTSDFRPVLHQGRWPPRSHSMGIFYERIEKIEVEDKQERIRRHMDPTGIDD